MIQALKSLQRDSADAPAPQVDASVAQNVAAESTSDPSPVANTHREQKPALTPHAGALIQAAESVSALFDELLFRCLEELSPSVIQADYRVTNKRQSQLKHDDRMPLEIAEGFSKQYLIPLAKSLWRASADHVHVEKFESNAASMVIVGIAVCDAGTNRPVGVLTALLPGTDAENRERINSLSAFASLTSMALASARQTQAMAAAIRSQPTAESSAIARAADCGSVREFGFIVVNAIQHQLDAEEVTLGTVLRNRVTVQAISGKTDFKASSPGVMRACQAQEECLDRQTMLLHQHGMDSGNPIHRQWSAATGNGNICTVPLNHGNEVVAVISVRRGSDRLFEKSELVDIVKSLQPYGSALRIVERASQPLKQRVQERVQTTFGTSESGNAWVKRGILGCLAAAILWIAFGSMTFRPICTTQVSAASMRQFAAPYEAKLEAVHVRAGDRVVTGQVMAEFDASPLRLERQSLEQQLASTTVDMRQLIATGEISSAAALQTRAESQLAQIAILDQQIAAATVVAPADGVVTAADLKKKIGRVFSRGDEVLQFAADGEWTLDIHVPDDVSPWVRTEQLGTFSAAANSSDALDFEIEQIDGSATTVDGRNVFVAHARLEGRPEWLKTGMEGTARISTVSRPVWWVGLRRSMDWVRLTF